jgi:hypothetical protein
MSSSGDRLPSYSEAKKDPPPKYSEKDPNPPPKYKRSSYTYGQNLNPHPHKGTKDYVRK